jgi:hypothetical protein
MGSCLSLLNADSAVEEINEQAHLHAQSCSSSHDTPPSTAVLCMAMVGTATEVNLHRITEKPRLIHIDLVGKRSTRE